MTADNTGDGERNEVFGDTVISFDTDSILARYDPHGRLEDYFKALLLENRRMNLVSRETSHQKLRLLAAESLLPLEFIGRSFESYLDIGSGGGLPAIPILICAHRIKKACLVERTIKKAGALRRILAQLGLRAEVVPLSFEDARPGGSFDLMTLRLVRSTNSLLTKIHARLKPGGLFVRYSLPTPQDAHLFAVKQYSYCSTEQTITKHFSILAKK